MKHLRSRIAQKALDVSEAVVLAVAFGDSVTQGVAEYSRFAHDSTYHRLLQQRLEQHYPTTTFSTLNAGVSGSTAPQALARIERDVLRHQPDLVLVAFGLNDAVTGGDEDLPAFEAALTDIVNRIHRDTRADVVLLTPPCMATRRHPHRIHPLHEAFVEAIIATETNGTLARYATAIRALAARFASNPDAAGRLALADIHAGWTRLRETGTDTDLWLANGLNHPDARGHQLAADLLFQTLIAPALSS